jgi:DNA-binding MarR family transcriptional regulator
MLCGAISQTEESRVLARRSELMTALTHALDEGRATQPRTWPPPLTSECLVGAAESLIRSWLREGPQPPLVNLLGPLMAAIVLPYRGAVAARRELSRPMPNTARPTAAPRLPARHPLDGVAFRFTYRTLRVLDAVDQQPDASNCEVAMAAGVNDQGQISKLLARLKRLELVADGRTPDDRRSVNAWRLTPLGEQVHNAMTAQLTYVGSSANGHGGGAPRARAARAGKDAGRRSW